jgi:hypothetical protein
MNKYSQYTLDQLVELMKERSTMGLNQQRELHEAYRIKFQEFLDDARTRHASILAVLGSNYARCLSN